MSRNRKTDYAVQNKQGIQLTQRQARRAAEDVEQRKRLTRPGREESLKVEREEERKKKRQEGKEQQEWGKRSPLERPKDQKHPGSPEETKISYISDPSRRQNITEGTCRGSTI